MKRFIYIISILLIVLVGFWIHLYAKSKQHVIPITPKEDIENEYSLEEKVGQRFIWGITGPTLSSESATLITNTHAGGVILMDDLHDSEIASLTAQIQLLPHTFPFIIAIDQEGGVVKRRIDDANPGGLQLGMMDDDEFCETFKQTNRSLYELGVNTNFGIIGDIGWLKNSYIHPRTYGDNLDKIKKKISIAIRCSNPILTTVKHFPGHGRTLYNSHLTIPDIKESFIDWEATDAQPFLEAIHHSVDFIMFGHLRYTSISSEPASLSNKFHSYIKDQGFTGLIVTDDLGMLENADYNPKDVLLKALDANNDILLYVTSKSDPYALFTEALLYATSSANRLNSITTIFKHITSFKMNRLKND